MSHPFLHHSETSVKIWGGTREDYAPIHEWLDATKEFFCDIRHRALRHHSYGISEAVRIFGVEVINASGKKVDVSSICTQHILEDCGGTVPTIDSWLEKLIRQSWMGCFDEAPLHLQARQHAEDSVRIYKGDVNDYIRIHEWLDETKGIFNDFRHRALRHHSQGIFEAERVFGRVVTNSDGKEVPVRYLCEQHIKKDCGGKVPSISDWLIHVPTQSWMGRNYEVVGSVETRKKDSPPDALL